MNSTSQTLIRFLRFTIGPSSTQLFEHHLSFHGSLLLLSSRLEFDHLVSPNPHLTQTRGPMLHFNVLVQFVIYHLLRAAPHLSLACHSKTGRSRPGKASAGGLRVWPVPAVSHEPGPAFRRLPHLTPQADLLRFPALSALPGKSP